jgi:predicted deacylase
MARPLIAMAQSATSPVPPIEVVFPDLAPHAAGNTGIPYAWTFESGRAGPHLLVQALTHGNEVCGAIALDRLLRERLRPARGTLSLVFANVAATTGRTERTFASRCVDEDSTGYGPPRSSRVRATASSSGARGN